MTRSGVLAVAALVALAFSLPSDAYADPPWKNGHGKGNKHASKGKGKGRAGDCKYEYKYGPRGYEEKWKCDNAGYFQPGPPPWAPAHGYRRKQGGSYAFPTGLLGGRCRADLLDGPTIGGLVGAAAGGFAGAQIGKGKGQLAATAVGTSA